MDTLHHFYYYYCHHNHNRVTSNIYVSIFGCNSKASSIYGNTIYLPQISYASTSVDLSNKDSYHYFARTCASDDAQGPTLVNALTDLGIVPYVAIIYTTDNYATSLTNSFATRYLQVEYIQTPCHCYNIFQLYHRWQHYFTAVCLRHRADYINDIYGHRRSRCSLRCPCHPSDYVSRSS
jgi:hypothetical protein